MLHQHSQNVPLLPLQAGVSPYEAHCDVDDDLLYSASSLDKRAWYAGPWASRLGDLAKRSSNGLLPLLVGLPLLVSIIAHIYFQMFSTLHVFLALVWVGLPAATVSTIAAIASRFFSGGEAKRDHLKASVLLALLFTVTWRTFTVSPHRGFSEPGTVSTSNETIFIAVNLYNSEPLFPHFSDSLLHLAHLLGEQNVYVSIYESNSKDNTKQHLSILQHNLELRGIQNRIRMLDNSRRTEFERIERLALIRNEALSPIHDGIHGLHDRTFAKVLWLNDIFFRPGEFCLLWFPTRSRTRNDAHLLHCVSHPPTSC